MYKKRIIRKKFIFISLILSMSIIGVGYAIWNDEMQINLALKTGFIKPLFFVENEKVNFDSGELLFSLSNGGRELFIDGKVYPNFNESISIKIADEGTIPSIFKNLYIDDENISELSSYSKNKQTNNLNIYNNIELFELNINPNSNNEKQKELNENNSNLITKNLGLEKEIEYLKEKIKLYDKEENYKFNYILTFEQGL